MSQVRLWRWRLSAAVRQSSRWLEGAISWMRRRHLLLRMLGASVLFALWIVVRFHWSDQFSTIGVYGLLTPVIFFTAWVAGLTPSLWLTSLFLIAQFWFFVPHPMGVGRLLNAVVFGVAAVVGNVLIGSRRMVVGELQSSEERYRTIVETAQEGVWMLDAKGSTRLANPALLNMLGTNLSKLSGRPLTELLETPNRGEWERVQKQADQDGRSRTELRFRRDDGGLLWADTSVTCLRLEDNSIRGYAVLLADVTERQTSEERKALLLDIIDLLTTSLDFDETLQIFARATIPLMGDWCSIDLLVGDRFERRVIVHADTAIVAEGYDLARQLPTASDQIERYKQLIMERDPVLVPDLQQPGVADQHGELVANLAIKLGMAKAILAPLYVGDHAVGVIAYAAGEGRVYTQGDLELAKDLAFQAAFALRNAELYGQSREQAARLTTMLTQLQEGVAIVGADDRVVYSNPSMDMMVGGDGTGRSISRYHAKTAPYATPLVEAMRTRRPVPSFEVELPGRDGRRRFALGTATPIIEDGQLLGAVATLRDITERKLVEEQKDQFISIASHELRTPITSLKLNIQRTVRQARKRRAPTEELEALEAMSRQSDRLIRLIRNLLDVSRLEGGQLAINVRPLALSAYLGDVLERLQQMDPERPVTVGGSIDVQVLADPDRIEQVLINLMSNSLQHSPAGSPVALSVTKEHGRVVIALRDEGEGIERAKQVHLFERFYQAHTGQSVGAGLGLYIAKQIVLQHHGTIWVSSEPGAGSTFYFSLPTAMSTELADRRNVRIKR